MIAQRLSLLVFAVSLALTAAGIGLLAVTLSQPLPSGDFGFRGFAAVIAVSFSVVGWLVTGRQRANALGWLFASVGMLTAAQVFAQGYAVYGVFAHPGSLPGAIWAAWLYSWIWVPSATIIGIHILLLFPDGRLMALSLRPLAWLGALLGGTISALVALAPGALTNFNTLQNPAALPIIPVSDSAVAGLLFGLLGLLFAASAFSLAVRFRRSSGIARQQLRWIAYAGAILALSVVPSSVSTGSESPLAKIAQVMLILAMGGVAVAAGIAILRYRLYDLDLLINRTLVYGTVTVVLAVAFGIANVGLQRIVESLTGQQSDLVAGTLGVGAALAFGPLRRIVRPMVDRVLPSRAVLTLLFTDIVGSTKAVVEMGDERWRALLGRYRAAVRQELARAGGHEVDTAGDGFFATFGRPAAGLSCAWAVRVAVRRLGLEVRTGVHLGECEMRGEEVSGLAVHMAARVMATAADGEILISSALREAVTNSGFEFADRGRHELKGVPGAWELYALGGSP